MATQMLESMKETIECTRPEATDVFDAVVDNVDALMLSGETSSGKYPAHAIEKMRALAHNAETYINERASGGTVFIDDTQIQKHFRQLEQIRHRAELWQERWIEIGKEYSVRSAEGEITEDEYHFVDELVRLKNKRLRKQHSTDRITHAACLMSIDAGDHRRHARCEAIVAPTTSGRTARMLSRFRPRVWILAQPHNQLTARKLTVDRGVMAIDILPVQKGGTEVDSLILQSRQAFDRKYKELIGEDRDATIIFTCGSPLGEVGTTNMIQRWDIKRRA
jgi:pyruvate kinase